MIEVIGTNNATLKMGIDSIREFTVPSNTPGGDLSAPPNPNAVVATSTGTVVSSGNVVTAIVSTGTSAVAPTDVKKTQTGSSLSQADALPQAGFGSTAVIMVVSAIFASFLLLRRRKI